MSLYTGNLATQGETEIKYRLRLWAAESYNPQSDNGELVYRVKVNVYGQTSDTVARAEDDEGTSYYYRGAVRNNYVSFAGFIWRIISRNGDGSVRLIYSGKSTSDTGTSVTIGNSQYNSKYWNPAYVGYKYNENFHFMKVMKQQDTIGLLIQQNITLEQVIRLVNQPRNSH